MNSKPIISTDTLKTVFQGALGAMTFGAYHQYTTNKMMELNNELQNTRMEQLERQHRMEYTQLEQQNKKMQLELETLKKRSWLY
jgi:hypothetical protein